VNDVPGQCKAGELAFPPYKIMKVNGLKIGILGFTTQRGIPAVSFQTTDFRFTGAAPGGLPEMPHYIDVLRNQERVDVIVMVSELGLGTNVYYAEKYPGVDVILSSDMHEITPKVVVASTGTLISEAGQDGTKVAEYHLRVAENGKVSLTNYQYHTITDLIPPDFRVALQVAVIRAPFVAGPFFRPHKNPFNDSYLSTPVDEVVGYSAVDLYRGNFSDEIMPGVLEGSSHDFLTDAFSEEADADIGTIRGFRYGTHVRSGPITMEDLFHFVSVGPQIAKGTITGQQLKSQLEAGANGALSPDILTWSGGWIFGYSNVRYDIDAYKPNGSRISNVTVKRQGSSTYEPLDPNATYTIAGYYYDQQPTAVGGFTPAAGSISVLKGAGGETLDGTDVVAKYLKTNIANPELNRVHPLYPLPLPVYGNPEIQPLLGVPTIH
jgi:sulfur-oxidizing protein SoxB